MEQLRRFAGSVIFHFVFRTMKVAVGHAHSSIQISGLQALMRAPHGCPLTLGFTLQA